MNVRFRRFSYTRCTSTLRSHFGTNYGEVKPAKREELSQAVSR